MVYPKFNNTNSKLFRYKQRITLMHRKVSFNGDRTARGDEFKTSSFMISLQLPSYKIHFVFYAYDEIEDR